MQPGRPSPAAQAEALARSGRIAEGVMLLNRLAAAGDAAALFKLAAWKLEAHFIPRDLVQARDLFRRSAAAGSHDAAVIYANLVTNGAGGPANWPRGLSLLRALAARDPACRRQLDLLEAMALTPEGDPASLPDGELLSSEPHVQLFRDFFTGDECDYMIEAAAPILAPSVVVDPNTGRNVPHPGRTSEMAGFTWQIENPAIHALNRRIAALSGTDVANGEPIQVLRYGPGQEYKVHFDAIPGLDNQRILTMLVYLNDDYQGGETWFQTPDLAVKARRGDALLFRNADGSGRGDKQAGHAGLPVKSGTKLIVSRWIHQRAYVAPAAKGYV